MSPGCRDRDPGPALQIVGESFRRRTSDPVPATSPWFDGTKVSIVAARGETIGIQVLHRGGGPVALHIEGFGVFRDPVEISFDDVDYFALVGPTG